MMKLSISVLGFSLSVVSLVGLNGCDRQGPPPKAVKEPSQVLDTAVGGTAKRAMHKAKEVETALGGADNRTAEASKASRENNLTNYSGCGLTRVCMSHPPFARSHHDTVLWPR